VSGREPRTSTAGASYDRTMREQRWGAVLAGVFGLLLIGGCGDGGDESTSDSAAEDVPEWLAPDDPVERTVAAGLEPAVREHLQTHRHAHLDVFVDGEPVLVPAGIGIDITNPGVQTFDDPISYGGIEECDQPCISPLHTHDETGILHTEAVANDLLTLGQFFTEWDVRLEDGCVGEFCDADTDIAFYVDGELHEGDPALIELEDRREIAIVIGTPPETIPDSADFSAA
jgi:hypothetical protein